MKLRYFSDLHLDFSGHFNFEQITPGPDEVCIVAGDICSIDEPIYDVFMNFMNKNFKKTFVIAGNHEYHNKTKSIDGAYEYFKKFANICFLDNTYEHYEGYCFIGTTLWSRITDPSYKINNADTVPNFDYNTLNESCAKFLHYTLGINNNCIVITHHLPSHKLIDPKYKGSPHNQWYCCDLDYLIELYKDDIKFWFYGHTHVPAKHVLHGVPFLCNPIGYPNENKNVNFSATVDLI